MILICDLLGSYFDKFSQKLHSFAQIGLETHLGNYPKLDFIEMSQKYIQVAGNSAEHMSTKHQIYQLILK